MFTQISNNAIEPNFPVFGSMATKKRPLLRPLKCSKVTFLSLKNTPLNTHLTESDSNISNLKNALDKIYVKDITSELVPDTTYFGSYNGNLNVLYYIQIGSKKFLFINIAFSPKSTKLNGQLAFFTLSNSYWPIRNVVFSGGYIDTFKTSRCWLSSAGKLNINCDGSIGNEMNVMGFVPLN